MASNDRPRYTPTGKLAQQGDKVTVIETAELAYIRVIGVRGHVTVFHPDWSQARVHHISDLTPGHVIDPATLARFPHGPYAVHGYNQVTTREVTRRNLSPSAAVAALANVIAGGCDPRTAHISLDTCG